MPIVQYIPEETNLPTNVAREVSRYVRHSLVPLEEYEQYRNAALKIDAKPVRYEAEALYKFKDKLQEDAEDEREYDDALDLGWAISNTKVAYWSQKRQAAVDAFVKSGKREKDFDHDAWTDSQGDMNKVEASLFWWRKQDSKDQHPAVLLTMLLDRYGYGQKGKTNAR